MGRTAAVSVHSSRLGAVVPQTWIRPAVLPHYVVGRPSIFVRTSARTSASGTSMPVSSR